LPFAATSQNHITNHQLLIRLEKESDQFLLNEQTKQNFNKDYPTIKRIRKVSKLFNIYAFDLLSTEEEKVTFINSLKKNHKVVSIGNDTPIIYRSISPDDERYKEQWYLQNININSIWQETTGGKTLNGTDIVVAVLEKGLDINHIDLRDNLWTNQNEIPDNSIDDDGNGYIDDYLGLNVDRLNSKHAIMRHGTQVAGIIGAKGNNKIGITGVNWDIKILPFSEVKNVSDAIKSYEYVYFLIQKFNESRGKEGAFVVATNNSFGWSMKPEELTMGFEFCEMFNKLGEVGILSVGAAPNSKVDVDIVGDVPNSCTSDFFIGVTSTNQNNELSKNASFGKKSIDLAAPGEDLLLLDTEDRYDFASGASFACPLVTGAIGLLYSLPCNVIESDAIRVPANTANFIKNILLSSTTFAPDLENKLVSNGILNISNAMNLIQGYCGEKKDDSFELLNVSPNPIQSQIQIEYSSTDFDSHTLIICNSIGQIVLKEEFNPPRFSSKIITKELHNLSAGIYFIILVKDGIFHSKKIIKI
jgi:subtilisin family serine protease